MNDTRLTPFTARRPRRPTLDRLRAAAGRRGRRPRASSTSPTAPSTPRSARCCWPPPTRAWSASPTPSEDHDAVLQALADRISPRVLRAPARLDRGGPGAGRVLRRPPAAASTCRWTCGCRPASAPTVLHHLPPTRLRRTAQLRGAGRAGRQPEGGPRGRHRLRDQPAAGRGALPPGGALRRRDRRLRRRRRGQAHPAGPGGGMSYRGPAVAGGRLGRGSRPSWTSYGCALIGPLLEPAETEEIAALYARRRTGSGPPSTWPGTGSARASTATSPSRSRSAVVELKQALYPRLLPIARDWWTRLGRAAPWPDDLDEWLEMCHAAGQTKSTPILLRYRRGRLERAAPRPLRRAGLPAAGRDQPQRARASTTPAASSCWSSSGRGPSPAAPPR